MTIHDTGVEFHNGDRITKFGIDDAGDLYLNGRKILTENKLTLPWWVNVAAIVGATAAFLQAVLAGVAYWFPHAAK